VKMTERFCIQPPDLMAVRKLSLLLCLTIPENRATAKVFNMLFCCER